MSKEVCGYWLIAFAIVFCLSLNGCSAPTGTRVVTAWGLWAAPFGTPIGLGYWHSEHGENVRGDNAAKPPVITLSPERRYDLFSGPAVTTIP